MFRDIPLVPVRRRDDGQCATSSILPVAQATRHRMAKHYLLFTAKPIADFLAIF